MSETKLTRGTNIIIVVFIVGIFAFLISNYGTELQNNPHAELSDNSKAYIVDLTGTGVAGLDGSVYEKNISNPLDEESAGNKLDFALDFVFGKKIAKSISTFFDVSLSFPKWIITKVFKLDLGAWNWFITLLNWLWRILIFVAIVYFWRNR